MRSSQSTTPKDHTSHFSEYGSPRSTSGAAYSTVPKELCERLEQLAAQCAMVRLSPKSHTLISNEAPTSRLADLRSRWMMRGREVCSASMPRATCMAILMRIGSGSGTLERWSRRCRVPRGQYSITSAMSGGTRHAPRNITTLGWRSCDSIVISRSNSVAACAASSKLPWSPHTRLTATSVLRHRPCHTSPKEPCPMRDSSCRS
mmetsp:Transcript_35966/g.91932  ORF Transcript_35966/g.91932 Transcript_35966/m.91932 type:complete len:204 (-) Transcript_35966:406-1017(-)